MYALSTPVNSIIETLNTNKALDRRISAAFHYVLANTAGRLSIGATTMQSPKVRLERDNEGFLLQTRFPFAVEGDVCAYTFLIGCRLGDVLFVPSKVHKPYGFTEITRKPWVSVIFTAERNNVIYFSAKEEGNMDRVIKALKPALGL